MHVPTKLGGDSKLILGGHELSVFIQGIGIKTAGIQTDKLGEPGLNIPGHLRKFFIGFGAGFHQEGMDRS